MSNGYVSVAGINDSAEFDDTVEAMNIMGLSEEEQGGEYILYTHPYRGYTSLAETGDKTISL